MKNNNFTKRFIAMTLTFLLLFSGMPTNIFADNENESNGISESIETFEILLNEMPEATYEENFEKSKTDYPDIDESNRNFLNVKHYKNKSKQNSMSSDENLDSNNRYKLFGQPEYNGFVLQTPKIENENKNPEQGKYKAFTHTNTGSLYFGYSDDHDNPLAYHNAISMWGYFVPENTGEYELLIYSDDGSYGEIKLSKDSDFEEFANEWTYHSPKEVATGGVHSLEKGKIYPIYMDYFENQTNHSTFELRMKFEGQVSGVPASYLYPSTKDKSRKNQAPVLTVSPETVNVMVGEYYDIKTGVSATDKEDGDLISKVVIEKNDIKFEQKDLNTDSETTYILTYSVTDGENEVSATRIINVVEPNFYITVDDEHEVYINGVILPGKDDGWEKVDKYYLDTDMNNVLIAVKGMDQDEENGHGHATISGFKAAYKVDDKWETTDNSWYSYVAEWDNNGPLEPPMDGSINWNQPGYSGDWDSATVVPSTRYPSGWKTSIESTDQFPSGVTIDWIWSDDYDENEDGDEENFDSPVYFINKIVAPNRAAVATDDTVSTDEEAPVSIDVLTNDSDPDGDPLEIKSVTQGSKGSAEITADKKAIIYTSGLNKFGDDSFTYTLVGGGTAEVYVTINPVNDAPLVSGDDKKTLEKTPVDIPLTVTEVDGEAYIITAEVKEVDGEVIGTVNVNADDAITFTPYPLFIGEATIDVTVTDDNSSALYDTCVVKVDVTKRDQTLTINNLTLKLHESKNPNPIIDPNYLDDEIVYEFLNNESSNGLPVVEKLANGEFKGLNIGEAEVKATLNERVETTFLIKVVPSEVTGFVYGPVTNGNVIIPAYDRAVVLAQMQTSKRTFVGNLRNNFTKTSLNDLRKNIFTTDTRFTTKIEAAAGNTEIPITTDEIAYFGMESGILTEGSEVIAVGDTTIIDYNDDTGEAKDKDAEWHEIKFGHEFTNKPVVIAELGSYTGRDRTHIRVKDVNHTSFKVFIEEWPEDRTTNHHNHELVSYVAFEPGVHNVDGKVIEVKQISDFNSDSQFDTVNFTANFDGEQSVFSQVQTTKDFVEAPNGKNSGQVWMGQNNISSGSVDLRMDSISGHKAEDVGVVAVGKEKDELIITSTLNAVPKIVIDGNDTVVTVTLVDQYGDPIVGSEVKIEDDNEGLVLATNNNDGTYSLTVRPEYGQPNTMSATVDGVKIDASKNVEVIKAGLELRTSTLVADPTSVVDGNTTEVTVTLKDQYDAPFTGKNVEIFIDGKTAGIAKEQPATPSTPGVYKLTITPVYGDVNEITAEVETVKIDEKAIVTVTKADRKLKTSTLLANPSSVVEGETAVVTVTLKDQYDEPFTRKNVEIFKDGITAGIATETLGTSGEYKLTITPVYGDENEITATVETVLIDEKDIVAVRDVTPPFVELNPIDDNDIIVTGKTEPLTNVQIFVNGKVIGEGKSDEEGNFEIEIPMQPADEEVTAVATDASENRGENKKIVTDATPPTIILDAIDDNDIIVTGKTEPLTNVQIFVNGKVIGEGKSDEEGNFEIEIPMQPADEEVTAVAIDASVNSGENKKIVTDATPPTIILDAIDDNDTIVTAKTEPLTTVKILLNDEVIGEGKSDEEGNFEIEISKQSVGKEIIAIAIDIADNSGEDSKIVTDGTAPVITLKGNTEVKVIFAKPYSDEGADVSDNSDDKVKLIRTYTNSSGDLLDEIDSKVSGIYTVHYNAQDESGNVAAEVTRTVIVRPDAPEIDAPSEVRRSATVNIITKDKNKRAVTFYSLDNEETWEIKDTFTLGRGTHKVFAKTILFTEAEYNKLAYSEVEVFTLKSDYVVSETVSQDILVKKRKDDDNTNNNVDDEKTFDDEKTPEGKPTELDTIIDDLNPLGAIVFNDPYVSGYTDGTFRPGNSISRAEMAAIFARILKLDISNPGEANFTDVSADHWAYKYIQAASDAGIFKGYEQPDGTYLFKPQAEIKRSEMAVVFVGYWNSKGIMVDGSDAPFTDVKGHWGSVYINKFFNAGVSVGFGDGTFRPDAETPREQAVAMVNGIIGRPKRNAMIPTFLDTNASRWSYGDIEAAVAGYTPLVNGQAEVEEEKVTE